VSWAPSKPKPAPRRLPNGNLPLSPHERDKRHKGTATALEAAAKRRAAMANKKHGRFKKKEYGSITQQCERIKKPTDDALLVGLLHKSNPVDP
jgi:hypothetical protein